LIGNEKEKEMKGKKQRGSKVLIPYKNRKQTVKARYILAMIF